MRSVCSVFLLWGCVAIPGFLFAASPDPKIDVQHYTFRISVNDRSDVIEGTADVVIRFTASDTRSFSLDLVGVAQKTGMRVQQVLKDSLPVSFQHHNDQLTISLPQAVSTGEVHTFRINYEGVPADGLIISQNKYGDRTFFGDNWPNRARYWLPTHDHPSDKATCEFIIEAPAHYEVIANGTKQEESDLPPIHGQRRKLTHWATPHPIATKVMVFGAARFAIRYHSANEPTDIQDWVYPEDRELGFRHLNTTANIVKFYEQQIGPYPYEKLANVQSRTRYGGMENAGNIFYNEDAIEKEETIEALVAHEVAHQWFGNAVTEKAWPDVWLSEGFATYLTHLYHAHTYGYDSLVARLAQDKERIFSFYIQSPESAVIDSKETNLFKLLNANAYQKGAWFLHMLRGEVGDKPFFASLRAYYQQYQHRNASTQDFRVVVERISGKPLSEFFDRWLYQPGHPVIEGTWKYAGMGKKLQISLSQVQSDNPFPLRLSVAVYYKGSERPEIKSFAFDQAQQDFTFKIKQKPTQVVLDPQQRWLVDQYFTKK